MSILKKVLGKKTQGYSEGASLPKLPSPKSLREPTLATHGIHEEKLRAFFGDHFAFTGEAPVIEGPLVCLGFTNRSGSNLLGGHMRSQPGLLGFHEQLNYEPVLKQSELHSIGSFPDYIARLGQARPKAWYGVKASVDQLMMLRRANIHAMYRDGMKIVQIHREDLIGQAISHHIALQMQAWTSRTQTDVHEDQIVFDAKQITAIAKSIRHSEFLMDLFAEAFEVPRLQITYDEITNMPKVSLRKIAKFVGRNPASINVIEPKLDRQSGDLNEAFRARYRREVLLKDLG